MTIAPPTVGPLVAQCLVRLVPTTGGAPLSVTVPATQPASAYTSLTAKDLISGTTYQVTAIPVYGNGSQGPSSAPGTVVMPASAAGSPPAPPTNSSLLLLHPKVLGVLSTSSTSGTTSVLAPVGAVSCTASLSPSGRRISAAVPGNGSALVGPSKMPIDVTQLAPGSKNTVQVQCEGADGALSPLSVPYVFETLPLGSNAPVVTNLEGLSHSFNISIAAPAGLTVVNYIIVAYNTDGGSGVALNITIPASGNLTTSIVSGVTAGKTYSVVATGVDSNGALTAPSPVSSVVIPPEVAYAPQVAVGAASRISYIADLYDKRILMVNSSGSITTVAGSVADLEQTLERMTLSQVQGWNNAWLLHLILLETCTLQIT